MFFKEKPAKLPPKYSSIPLPKFETASLQKGPHFLRLYNILPISVDIYLNAAPVLSGIASGEISNYLAVHTPFAEIKIYSSADRQLLLKKQIEFSEENYALLCLSLMNNQYNLQYVEEPQCSLPPGMAALRAIVLSDDGRNFDIILLDKKKNKKLIEAVNPIYTSDYVKIKASAAHHILVTPNDLSVSQAEMEAVLQSQCAYTLLIHCPMQKPPVLNIKLVHNCF